MGDDRKPGHYAVNFERETGPFAAPELASRAAAKMPGAWLEYVPPPDVFDPPAHLCPEWEFSQEAGIRTARRARDGLVVERFASFNAEADPVPADVVLWVLGAPEH